MATITNLVILPPWKWRAMIYHGHLIVGFERTQNNYLYWRKVF